MIKIRAQMTVATPKPASVATRRMGYVSAKKTWTVTTAMCAVA